MVKSREEGEVIASGVDVGAVAAAAVADDDGGWGATAENAWVTGALPWKLYGRLVLVKSLAIFSIDGMERRYAVGWL
eukprot:scaffold482_cov266-Amphora_coffeaeformis.AAC.27